MERRWSTRKNLYLSIALEIPSYNRRVVPATLLDISACGAFIETRVLLPDDAALTIELKLPGGSVQSSFRLKTRMVRRTVRGVAVAFIGMSAAAINTLIEALSRYERQLEPVKPDTSSDFVMNSRLALN